MKVSVITPALNEEITIGKLVKNLMADPFPSKEVIVVDGGSKDKTADIAREAGAVVIKEKGVKCPANARNQGAKASHGEILCFLDADNGVNPLFITNAVRNFADPNVVAVASKIEPVCRTWIQKVLASTRRSSLASLSKEKLAEKGRPYTFMRKEVFESFGGYPLLGVREDTLLAHKLSIYLENNPTKRTVSEPGSVIFKGLSSSVREFFAVSAWYGRTMIPYFRESKLPFLKKLILLGLPIVYLISILSIPLLVISPWFLIPASPYIAKLLVIVYEALKNHNGYALLTPIVDLIKGAGHLIGLLQYLLGKKRLSR